MKMRKLGRSGLEISVIGLGTWAIGGADWRFSWGPQDDEQSEKTILKALDLGINWIDTAAVYGLGHAEEIVGKALKGMKKKPIIATKCERVWDKKGNIAGNMKKESIKHEAEASLKRLGVEVIDLYQIHWPEPDNEIEEGWQAIADLVKEGKVRYGGVSNFNVSQLERAESIFPVTSLQPPYSLIVPDIENNILGYCGNTNTGVIAYSPMYKGLLTGGFTGQRAENLPENDHRRFDRHFLEPELSINLTFVNKLSRIAEMSGRTVSQLAIAWVLRRPEVSAAIVGARRPEQISETYQASDWSLDEAVQAEIDLLIKERQDAVKKSL
ncbi:MAG: aldo/keto reductase [Brevinematales bacterium]|jgi:aryl-alcohol dehydrogenase-like predicted oxidoreductase